MITSTWVGAINILFLAPQQTKFDKIVLIILNHLSLIVEIVISAFRLHSPQFIIAYRIYTIHT